MACIPWARTPRTAALTTGLATVDVIDPAAQSPVGQQNLLRLGLDTRTDAQATRYPPPFLISFMPEPPASVVTPPTP